MADGTKSGESDPGSKGSDEQAGTEEPAAISVLSRIGPSGKSPVSARRTVPFDRRSGDRRQSTVVDENYRVAVLLPCYNEALTIGTVVTDFAAALPDAAIWVYDNNSSDDTASVARAAGASVQEELKPGKGQVVSRMFREIDADIYVMADGDGTYDAQAAPLLIDQLVSNRLDMVVGRRRELPTDLETYRPGHRLGNAVLTGAVEYIFGQGSLDMLSGYRVLSRRYVKSFPTTSRGFEIETEMTVHALDLRLPFSEVDTVYRERPPDSHSKLRTIPDGIKITGFIVRLVKEYRPATFFGVLGLVFAAAAVLARLALYNPLISLLSLNTARGVVTGLVVLTVVMLGAGLILDSVSRGRRDVKRLMYLGVAGPSPGPLLAAKPASEAASQTIRFGSRDRP